MSVSKMVILGLAFIAGTAAVKLVPILINKAADSAQTSNGNQAFVQTDPHQDDVNTADLAQAISMYGLSNDATSKAADKTFYSNGAYSRASELASSTTSKLAALGHSEYSLTMPPGENRVLIRNNSTGQAISMQYTNH